MPEFWKQFDFKEYLYLHATVYLYLYVKGIFVNVFALRFFCICERRSRRKPLVLPLPKLVFTIMENCDFFSTAIWTFMVIMIMMIMTILVLMTNGRWPSWWRRHLCSPHTWSEKIPVASKANFKVRPLHLGSFLIVVNFIYFSIFRYFFSYLQLYITDLVVSALNCLTILNWTA